MILGENLEADQMTDTETKTRLNSSPIDELGNWCLTGRQGA